MINTEKLTKLRYKIVSIVGAMAALKVAKNEVRRRLKKAIMSLSESERHRQSVALCQKVRLVSWSDR